MWPPPSNSHHQDYSIFSRESPKKTFICHWNPGRGATPKVNPYSNPLPFWKKNIGIFHFEKINLHGLHGPAVERRGEPEAGTKVGSVERLVGINGWDQWWWQLAYFWEFSPRKIGEDEPNLTSIFFRWVGSTTNQERL